MGQLAYEVTECRLHPGEWLAEGIDMEGDGDCYMARFSGLAAEALAREYADLKNGSRKALAAQCSTSTSISSTQVCGLE